MLNKYKTAITIGFAAILVLVLGFKFFSAGDAPSEGILGRTAVDLHGLDRFTKTEGSCIAGYSVLPAGRDSRGQHYALYLKLTSHPKNEEGLSHFLTNQKCEDETYSVLKKVAEIFAIPPDKGLITNVYLTSSGKQVEGF